MDNCRHVGHMRIAKGHSVLNPEKWQCSVCFTTESVWVSVQCYNLNEIDMCIVVVLKVILLLPFIYKNL